MKTTAIPTALLLHFHADACRPRLLSRLERQQLRRLHDE
jgi:hypothetical protein